MRGAFPDDRWGKDWTDNFENGLGYREVSTPDRTLDSAHEWVEPVITKTASMAFLLPEV